MISILFFCVLNKKKLNLAAITLKGDKFTTERNINMNFLRRTMRRLKEAAVTLFWVIFAFEFLKVMLT